MRYVVGIDEVGRGPLAGPVVLAAAAIPVAFRPRLCQGPGRRSAPLRDSKKLTAIQRGKWAAYLAVHPKVSFAIVRAYPATIDGLNISRAANQAARRALRKVMALLPEAEFTGIYLDGGLYLRQLRHPRKRAALHTETVVLSGGRRITAHTLVRADEKITAVKIAAVLAKVHRARFMVRQAKFFPGYGFEKHKGYGTRAHSAAIKKFGPTRLHRLTFLRTS